MIGRSAVLAAALLAQPAAVQAQSTDSPPTQPSPAASSGSANETNPASVTPPHAEASKADVKDQTVTVTAKVSALQTSIDRRSYSVANDLQKATGGSVADVLRNVPSVDVDVQGAVSLRGSTSVTILIDGHPSALLQGQNRGDALQQLPADQIERVEVMTNPSAAFSPEGTAGIINLVTKKTSRSATKTTGTIKATLGTGGRYSASASETYSQGGLSLSGNAGFRQNQGRNDGASTSTLTDPVTGAVSHNQSASAGDFSSKSGNLHGGFDYDIDPKTRISGELNVYPGAYRSRSQTAYTSDAATGIQSKDYTSGSSSVDRFVDVGGAATILRKLAGDDHEISVRLSRDDYVSKSVNSALFDYTDPSQADLYQGLRSHDGGVTTDLKAEYKGPLPGQAKLVAGYELKYDRQDDDNQSALGTSSANAVVVPGLTNNFKASQAVHALYATYQRPFGPLTVMPGLRLEEVDIDLDQITQQVEAGQSYFHAYPTLHLAYKLDDNQQLTASYSERVQRPGLQSLNPFRVYSSPLSYSQGNPQLQPQITDSFELGYEFRQKTTYYLATLYYRDNRKQFTSIQQDIGGGVLLSTQANLGASRNAGLELVANGPIGKTLTYSASGSVYWNEIDPGGVAFASPRSGVMAYGKVSLNWNPTPKDFFQINVNGRSQPLTAQGHYGSYIGTNLGYRHKVDDKLAFVATVNDPFDQSRFVDVIDIPGLKSQSRFQYHQRALYLGFTYALGTAKIRGSEGFDFGGSGAPGK